MKKIKLRFIVILTSLILLTYCVYAFDLPKWFPFNQQTALAEWQEKIFYNKVVYRVEPHAGAGHLEAKSSQACSGLFYPMKFNVYDFPLMSWDWKVNQFPDKSSGEPKKQGWVERDDYAARVYVIFSGWNFMNTKSLEYVWDENLPAETIMTSPYFPNIKLIVAESGKENKDQWVFEKRNIVEDYKKAFGRIPPRNVSAIALMTDADNTLSTAEALYKNIKVGYNDE